MYRFDKSAHADTFARDHLPSSEIWPVIDAVELDYPVRLNAAVELLDRMVERGYGPGPCLRTEDSAWSYAELLDRANRIANVLVAELALLPGERVLLRDANTPMLVACWFAVLKAGGIAVATMPQLRANELAHIVKKAKIKYALCAQEFSEELEKVQRSTPDLEKLVLFRTEDSGGLEARMKHQSAQFNNVLTSHDDVALIAFSSGTTGEAKATMHFHRDLLAVCDCFPKYVLKPESRDIFCGSPPLAFTFGLGGLLLFPMRVGASTLLLPKVTAEGLLRAIERHGCTVLFTAPRLYRLMVDLAPRFDLSSLKKCVSAGETLPLPVFKAWQRATGIKIIDGIGSTELLHIFISAGGDDIRPGATGKPVPGYQAIVVDEQGCPVPPNTIGRLAVRGPTGCRYLDAPEQQCHYVQNGWNITGDAYRMDDDGYFWYVARTDDLIVSSGYKISGPEIEATLLGHPKVLECAVIGVPDQERGQIVKAFVVLCEGHAANDATCRELQEHVKAQIAPYKYPRAIEFVTTLPRTATGKIQRFRLRELGNQP
ncbi:MAG TPA: benzoate-CoA ligase family protein [Candidatus Solibacter sp.]|jgi:2-aminobenzoate-CoA ligase|nr:benzoate-CoA ligase family protein [Candidatus Solibacter sp.]